MKHETVKCDRHEHRDVSGDLDGRRTGGLRSNRRINALYPRIHRNPDRIGNGVPHPYAQRLAR